MTNQVKLLDVVALTVDLPEHNLWRGQVGTVVELFEDGKAFEVEFSDRKGRTFESVGLHVNQFMVLHFEPMGKASSSVRGTPGNQLLRFAYSIPTSDLTLMQQAVEQDREQVDAKSYQDDADMQTGVTK